MSDNKVKEIFRSKQGDGFDQGYNAATYMEFYQPGDRFSEIFYDAASQLSSLHRYLEYSRRYIWRYLEEGAACEKQLFDDGAAAEEEILYDETFGADKKYLLRYNDESVFLMIYTLFESFVHRLVEEQEREQHLDFKSRNYQGPMIARYTAFLKESCHMNIVFEDALWERFQRIRKIRNVFIHSSGVVSQNAFRRALEREQPELLEENRLVLNYDFLIGVFETIGEMLRAVEKAYWE